jgi:hypothetical protein
MMDLISSMFHDDKEAKEGKEDRIVLRLYQTAK